MVAAEFGFTQFRKEIQHHNILKQNAI